MYTDLGSSRAASPEFVPEFVTLLVPDFVTEFLAEFVGGPLVDSLRRLC
jgi:hypothetical protein